MIRLAVVCVAACTAWGAPATTSPVVTKAATQPAGSRIQFNNDGITLVDGLPFFPIGMFTYELDSTVLAELRELRCNTILHGFKPDQLDLIHSNTLMAVCETDDAWVRAALHHPALLAWYLTDEPEGREPPETSRKRFAALKSLDASHPIGLCHTSFEALTRYKDACDFTMTDIYPITPQRDKNVMGVSIMMDEARRVHGVNWPQWTYIQTFGGPETDNGVWAVPLPHEVRFMAYQALVHRATGILYFSYWPRQPRTWQSIASLNREIQRLAPRLVAPGKEFVPEVDSSVIQIRGRTVSAPDKASSGFIIAINTSPRSVQATIRTAHAPPDLEAVFEHRKPTRSPDGGWLERFEPYDVHVYLWGDDPDIRLAREQGTP